MEINIILIYYPLCHFAEKENVYNKSKNIAQDWTEKAFRISLLSALMCLICSVQKEI